MTKEELLRTLYWKPCVTAYKEGALEYIREAREEELLRFLQEFRPGSVSDTLTLLMLWKPLHELFPANPTVKEMEQVLRTRFPQDPLLVGHMMFKKMLPLL
jgi:hypothetical protein